MIKHIKKYKVSNNLIAVSFISFEDKICNIILDKNYNIQYLYNIKKSKILIDQIKLIFTIVTIKYNNNHTNIISKINNAIKNRYSKFGFFGFLFKIIDINHIEVCHSFQAYEVLLKFLCFKKTCLFIQTLKEITDYFSGKIIEEKFKLKIENILTIKDKFGDFLLTENEYIIKEIL